MNEQTKTTINRPVWEIADLEEQLTLCKVVRYLDLRAMHQSNGTSQALEDLRIGCLTDELWSKTADRQQTADNLKALAEAERRIADKARYTIFKAVRATEEDRAEALEILNEYTTLAENNSGERQDIEKQNSHTTASLAQDMLHTIWLELQTIIADTTRHTDKAFGELCKAGRQFVTDFTAVTAIDGNNTTTRPLSTAEAIELMTRYDINPLARPRQSWRQTTKGCTGYYTLEPRTRKKDIDPKKVDPATIANYAHYNNMCVWYYENVTLPTTRSTHETAFSALNAKAIALDFWHSQTQAQKISALGLDPTDNQILCLICHTQTIRTKDSTDTLTDHDPRTAQAILDSALKNIDIIALAEGANLSLQARTALKAMTTPEAIQTAKEAYNKAVENGKTQLAKLEADRAKAGKKPLRPGKVKQYQKQFQTTADNAYNTALWVYGLTVAGYSQTAQAKARCVISKALAKALAKAPDTVTPGAVDFDRLMKQKPHSRYSTDTTPRKDLVTVWSEADTITYIDQNGNKSNRPKPKTYSPVTVWTESGIAPEAINPGIDSRASDILARDTYRQTASKATPPEKTPKEQREWERLCRRDSELAELWRQFDSIYGAIDNPYIAKYAKA